MRFIKKVKYFGAVILLASLLFYLSYTGITGYLGRELVELPAIRDFVSPERDADRTVDIPAQLDSSTQKAVDKFMQEFNIPLARQEDFIKQAKDVIRDLEETPYQIVPPDSENPDKNKPIPPESLDNCFERVITECS